MTTSPRLHPSENTIDIRALAAGDAGVFWRLRLEALEQEPRAFGEAAEEHRKLSLEVLAGRLASNQSGNFVLGAFAAQELVGTAGFSRDTRLKRRHKGRVWGVYVQPQYRARGVAKLLLAELIRAARSEPGLEQIILTVGQYQSAAKRLYQSLGFEVFAHESRALKIADAYVDEDHMVLHLHQNAPA